MTILAITSFNSLSFNSATFINAENIISIYSSLNTVILVKLKNDSNI